MPSLNLDLDLEQHPKMRRLVVAVGPSAMLYVIRLWIYCAKFHPVDGRLDGYSPDEIERLAGWEQEPGKLVKALEKNFLDKTPKGHRIHDWKDHAGHIVAFKLRGKANALKRWGGHATSIPSSTANSNAPTDHIRQIRSEQIKKEEQRVVHPVDKSRPRIPGEADWQPIGKQLEKIVKGGP